MRETRLFFEVARQSNHARLFSLLWARQARRLNLDRQNLRVLVDQSLTKCKQATRLDVETGWNFSGPLADQIRRRDGTPVTLAQKRSRAEIHGAEGGAWTRCAWEKKHRQKISGWSNRYALRVREWLTPIEFRAISKLIIRGLRRIEDYPPSYA